MKLGYINEIKMENAAQPVAGGNITYSIVVTNNGPSNALNVVATETLPAEVSFVETTGACSNNPNGVPNCQLGDFSAGEIKTYQVIVATDPSLPDTTVTNRVSVSSSTPDPDASNNQATEDTLILAIVTVPTLNPYGLLLLLLLILTSTARRLRLHE